MSKTQITIRRPDDFHVHLREGEMLQIVAKHTARHFGRALVMPNLTPPILTAKEAIRYEEEIKSYTEGHDFTPLMTIKITDKTIPQAIQDAKAVGVIAGKLYPQGVTTNSEDGWSDLKKLWNVFAEMERYNMILCLHGETPGVFCMDRELHFIEYMLPTIIHKFPLLRIVLEHVTTAEGVDAVLQHENVAGTITVHHLLLTLDDIVGGLLSPHHFCKPIAKRPSDREALVRIATAQVDGHERFFLGTDSAPHYREAKECDAGCAGVFTAPVALPLLAEIFEGVGALDKLENFTSRNGSDFYGLFQNTQYITLRKESWKVPQTYMGIVPLRAGQEIAWQVV